MLEKLDLKVDGQIDKNFDYIKQGFPSVITETQDENGKIVEKIDFEKLKQELSDQIIEGKEAYNFTWPGKKKAILEANTPTNKTLRPCREESVNFDTTENLYIEGDNLEVLKLLQNTYFKKVKMIYIDPPYNTGNDFIYNDKFTMDSEEYEEATGLRDEDGDIQFKQNKTSNPRYHSDWCTMIYSRLKLARNLLTDDGVIFISIDENEFNNLKKICDEIFGEWSFIENFIWIKNSTKNLSKTTSTNHEYVLCYAKNKSIVEEHNLFKLEKPGLKEVQAILLEANQNKLSIEETEQKLKNFYKSRSDLKGISMYDRVEYRFDEILGQNCYQAYTLSDSSAPKSTGKADTYEVLHPITGKPCKVPSRGWRFKQSTMNEMIKNNLIEFYNDENHVPRVKRFLNNVELEVMKSSIEDFMDGKKELIKLFGDSPFDNPKPTTLISKFIKSLGDIDIIMDFFSGSATTAHAVMQLNAEDGGKRKFILVNLPEECKKDSEAYKQGFKNICEIGKERIRRAGKKIKEEFLSKKDITEEEKQRIENLDIGFRVLKLDSNNMIDTSFTPGETTQDLLSQLQENIKPDRNSEDLLYACFIKFALEFNIPYEIKDVDGFKIYVVNENELVTCFDKNITMKVVEAMADLKPMRVVFRDNSFATSADRINAEQIFKYRSPETDEKII